MARPIRIEKVFTGLFQASVLALALSGCEQPEKAKESTTSAASIQLNPQAFAAQAGLEAYTSLSQASQSAQVLDSKLASFLYHPNPMSQQGIKDAWRQAYDDYLRSLVFSYLPIQDPPDWYKERIAYKDILIQLDSWPVQGGYIDYVSGYPFSGIVNDLTLTINETTLLNQHRFTDVTNASLGYHALEFMIWGDDGARTAHDFFPQENTAPVLISEGGSAFENNPHRIPEDQTPATEIQGEPQTQPAEIEAEQPSNEAGEISEAGEVSEPVQPEPQNHNRRRQYIQLVSELLQKDLNRIQRRWEPSTGYYAQLIQQSTPENTLQAALIAAQRLISEEILNKRFSLESSEFSNSSVRDIQVLLNGLQAWFKPADESLQEGSLMFLMEQSNPTHAGQFAQQLSDSQQCLELPAGEQADNQLLQQCKQQIIGLLSALQTSARSMKVVLPALD